MMFNLESYLSEKRKQIDSFLGKRIHQGEPSRIVLAMEHSLMAGGKRLRPVLCMASAEAVGNGNKHEVMKTACALEMIHTYSLIHDDLPAMDDDDLRRGKATCHKAFDEATAILAGDALLTLAFRILSSCENKNSALAVQKLEIIGAIAKASGYRGMIAGQMKDMESEGSVLDLEDLQKMHEMKTGALIKASIFAGALLGGGDDIHIEALEVYGEYLGLAFQVIDDVLNVEGDPDLMGKARGSDEKRGKATYTSILGTKKSKELARNLINEALKAIDFFDNRSKPLRALASYIADRKR